MKESMREYIPSKQLLDVATGLLYIAARFHDAEEVKEGLSCGFARPDAEWNRWTALQWAVINSNSAHPEDPAVKATVKVFLDAGANPKKVVYGDSLVDLALKNNQVETAFHLMKHCQKDIKYEPTGISRTRKA